MLLEGSGRESIEVETVIFSAESELPHDDTSILVNADLGAELLQTVRETWKARASTSYTTWPGCSNSEGGNGHDFSSNVADIVEAHAPVYGAADSANYAAELVPIDVIRRAR